MNLSHQLKQAIFTGYQLRRDEALQLYRAPLDELCTAADELRRHFCGSAFDLCTISNGKSGRCPENCKFCAQSSQYCTTVTEYPLQDSDSIVSQALHNQTAGIHRFAIVTSGRQASASELQKLCRHYRELGNTTSLSLCASHGLLSYKQLCQLKSAGVTRYHNNLETSRRYFPHICTTHTYEDKIQTINSAIAAGLEVCSGGIMGLGEGPDDRIDLAFELQALGIASIPINVLNPVKGTPLEQLPPLTSEEVRRIVAIYRFILPAAAIRLAGGRGLLADKGKAVFQAGANAAISGDMLTTAGICVSDDLALLTSLGFEVTAHE